RIAPDRIEEGVAVVGAVRGAVGHALEIMVDLNQWWRMPGDITRGSGPGDARRGSGRLREAGALGGGGRRPAGVAVGGGEPGGAVDLGVMRMRRGVGGVRVAGGEMARSFDELRLALDADALDVFQPDVVLALGVSGARTLADLALRRNRWFTPHTWTNGIGL